MYTMNLETQHAIPASTNRFEPSETQCSDKKKLSSGPTKEELSAAIKARHFIPFYQPKLNLKTGHLAGVEVLARWLNPELGLLLPEEFISLMEQHALIGELTESLFVQTLAFAKAYSKTGCDIDFSINVSPVDLDDARLACRFSKLLEESGLRPDQVTIEVTETARCANLSAAIASLTCLRKRGFHISIDDFGIGYSSLELLNGLPFTELKIDRAFVRNAHSRAKSAAILEVIIDLAEKLGLHTVAEGIETPEEASFLRALGCDAGQGYFIARPMSQDELADFLGRFEPPLQAVA
jgi:EAL domain-containing protein (putative c-di-GMP-specific phosphodiesterase class I)